MKEVHVQLKSLRPILSVGTDQSFLNLFDEFMQEGEFGLALHVVCDFLLTLETSPIGQSSVDQIQQLHADMEIHDTCVQELQQRTRERLEGW